MLFERGLQAGEYEIVHEGDDTILKVNYEGSNIAPSLEDDAMCMSRTVSRLVENLDVTKIIFLEKRDFEYSFEQTQLLLEFAGIFKKLLKEKDMFSYQLLAADYPSRVLHQRYTELRNLIHNTLRADPIGAYVQLRRISRRERIELEKEIDEQYIEAIKKYLTLVDYVLGLLEKTKLVAQVKPYLAGYRTGDRTLYRKLFSPIIKPDFMFTKLMASFPAQGEEIDSYSLPDGTEVTIFRVPETIQPLYHLIPPEFKLSEEKYEILDLARNIISEHKPSRQEFVEPTRMRQVFHNVGHDLIEELTSYRNLKLRAKEIDELAAILVRYTVGFGLIEVILQDPQVQDITVNSPPGQIPLFLVHGKHENCYTNIIPTKTEAESWATKLRLVSGRPLDEANPILDTELLLPGARARVAAVAEPLNPQGLAFAFRRHRDKPWTLPLFMSQGMLNAQAAGILSFLIDGSRTFLVAGTRSAGKTSLLGAMMVEIMRRYRIITIEDTLELPTTSLRKIGFNIQPLKVQGALTHGTTEVSAEEGIRTTLRLGDSALIVGEVRSDEARALYEAMRVGALANVVAGTIHGDSPYGVFDRVVNDLKVPRTSFKATDIVVVANPIRSADGLHRWRRVTQITEVRKKWEEDPLAEGGFVDLMRYNSITDSLEPSHDLINGDSEILKSIAGNIKEYAGNWDAVWDNIMLRAKVKETLVQYATKAAMPDLLEADFVVLSNDEFHRRSDQVREESGNLDSKRIFVQWEEWLKREIRKRKPA
ncbi:type II/IV secretion system ATPase subunit [Candidatus Woesearchaeota archaeon]|nr:type II/IV secretion system ATPase subunit [Candidatus Woesearchaeota archaeon]